jgi:hypothetical protein
LAEVDSGTTGTATASTSTELAAKLTDTSTPEFQALTTGTYTSSVSAVAATDNNSGGGGGGGSSSDGLSTAVLIGIIAGGVGKYLL